MKKALFLVSVAICSIAMFSGCIKNKPYITTINPSLTAQIGTYNYTSATVVPSTLDTQSQELPLGYDSVENLFITGYTSDLIYTHDKIVLNVTRYRGRTGLFSIKSNEANAVYYHNRVANVATSGIISITKITTNSIIGYFSFATSSGVSVTNGNFSVALPDGNPF